MKGFKISGLSFMAALGLATTVWAFCDHEKSDAAAAAKQQPCSHAANDASVTTVSDTAKSEEKSGGCGKKGDAALTSDKKGGCGKKCPFSQSASSGDSARGPVDAMLASMPVMKYRVGDETTQCAKSAEEMAIKADKAITYVVGEKAFDSKADATVALTAALESEIEGLISMQYTVNGKTYKCPMEAKESAQKSESHVVYKVAGAECCNKEKAEKAAKLAADAVSTVKLSYKVGDDTFCCDKMAGMKSKETGKKMTFVVGSEETCCEQTAKLLLAQAKVRAIAEAASSAFSS